MIADVKYENKWYNDGRKHNNLSYTKQNQRLRKNGTRENRTILGEDGHDGTKQRLQRLPLRSYINARLDVLTLDQHINQDTDQHINQHTDQQQQRF